MAAIKMPRSTVKTHDGTLSHGTTRDFNGLHNVIEDCWFHKIEYTLTQDQGLSTGGRL